MIGWRIGLNVFCLLIATLLMGAERNLERIKMPTSPDISPDGKMIIFTWKGCIWKASVDGGVAIPLTFNLYRDDGAHFSPDGKEIAFSSQRGEHWQLYVMSESGGVPRKITNHSEGCFLLEWSPDGRSLVYLGNRDYGPFDSTRMFLTSALLPDSEHLLFDDYGKQGAISPDGSKILFVRGGPDYDRYRRNYLGSGASQIWMYDFKTKEYTLIHRHLWHCSSPVWMPDNGGFYFLSDESGMSNIWKHNLSTNETTQLTFFNDDPVSMLSVSRDGSTLIFSKLFDLYSFQPQNEKQGPKKIELWSETDTGHVFLKRRVFDKVVNGRQWGHVDFSKDGLEVVFSAGGAIWTMDTTLREASAINNDSHTFCSDVFFSPDEESVYFLRDEGDKCNIWCASKANPNNYWWQNRQFNLEPITTDESSKDCLKLSPDGKWFAYIESDSYLVIVDKNGENRKVLQKSPLVSNYVWSPDSRWIAACLRDEMDNDDIWLISIDGSMNPVNISCSPYADWSPAWSPDGKILSFISSNGLLREDTDPDVKYVYLSLKDDEKKNRDYLLERALKLMNQSRSSSQKKAEINSVNEQEQGSNMIVNVENIAQRVRTLDLGRYAAYTIFWVGDKKLAIQGFINGRRGTYTVDFPDNLKATLFTEAMGANAKLSQSGKLIWILDGVPANGLKKYPFKIFQEVHIGEYKKLVFRKVWQLIKDGFYDAKLNNLNWNEIRAKYEAMAGESENISSFQNVVNMMLGELGASHMAFYVDQKEWLDPSISVGWRPETSHLGIRFDASYEGPGLKVRDVIQNGPADSIRSRVLPDEIVLKINQQEVNPQMDLTSILNGISRRDILLEVMSIDGKKRDVLIHSISYSDVRTLLRDQEFAYKRTLVDLLSKNKLAYLNIERMDWSSFDKFAKDIFAMGVGKSGLVIDVRNNPGGFIADRLLTILCRPQHSITVPRCGKESYPIGYLVYPAWDKPIVVLCNQFSTSNAEIFSHAVKALKRGKLVGVTTSGDVIATPRMAVWDMGTLSIPRRGFFTKHDGEDMELHGAEPDYEVWDKPGELPNGKDVQLEKAVAVLMEDVKIAEATVQRPLIWKSERPKKQLKQPSKKSLFPLNSSK